MNRRDLVKTGSGLVLAGSLGWMLASPVEAGKGWCRMDPWAYFDDQLVEFWGYVRTELNGSGYPTTIVPGSAEFHIKVPQGHTFELDPTKPAPLCEVYTESVPAIADWSMRFRYMTTNGDQWGRLQVITHGEGDIEDYDRVFSGFSHTKTWDAT